MRTWFYDHPNLTLVLLGLWYLVCVGMMIRAVGHYDGWWKLIALCWLLLALRTLDDFKKCWYRT